MLANLLKVLGLAVAGCASTMCLVWYIDEEETPKSLIR